MTIDDRVRLCIEYLKRDGRKVSLRRIESETGIPKSTVARSDAYRQHLAEQRELAEYHDNRGKIPRPRDRAAEAAVMAAHADSVTYDPATVAAERDRPRPVASWTDDDWLRYILGWVCQTDEQRNSLRDGSPERRRQIVGLARLQWEGDQLDRRRAA